MLFLKNILTINYGLQYHNIWYRKTYYLLFFNNALLFYLSNKIEINYIKNKN
jgi:hypothetical protein